MNERYALYECDYETAEPHTRRMPDYERFNAKEIGDSRKNRHRLASELSMVRTPLEFVQFMSGLSVNAYAFDDFVPFGVMTAVPFLERSSASGKLCDAIDSMNERSGGADGVRYLDRSFDCNEYSYSLYRVIDVGDVLLARETLAPLAELSAIACGKASPDAERLVVDSGENLVRYQFVAPWAKKYEMYNPFLTIGFEAKDGGGGSFAPEDVLPVDGWRIRRLSRSECEIAADLELTPSRVERRYCSEVSPCVETALRTACGELIKLEAEGYEYEYDVREYRHSFFSFHWDGFDAGTVEFDRSFFLFTELTRGAFECIERGLQRVCPICGRPFFGSRSDVRTCSQTCRNAKSASGKLIR